MRPCFALSAACAVGAVIADWHDHEFSAYAAGTIALIFFAAGVVIAAIRPIEDTEDLY